MDNILRLIIVDDEEKVIDGLKKFVDWTSLGIEIVDTASNGRDGLARIKHHKPDIVLTDIKMPVMDGIELMRTLHSEGIDVKLVVLSGFEEFEYAREGMKYGVIDYILKPSMPDEISEIMRKAVKICLKEKERADNEKQLREKLQQSMPVLKEKLIEELFEGNITSQELEERCEFLGLDVHNKKFRVISIQIDAYQDFLGRFNEADRQFIKLSVLSRTGSCLGMNSSLLNFKERNAYILMFCDKNALNKENAELVCREAERLIQDCMANYEVSLSVGVGELAEDFTNIKESYNQSRECLKYKMQFGNGKVVFYEDIVFTQLKVPILDLYDRDKLVDALKIRDITVIYKCIDEMVKKIRKSGNIGLDYTKMVLTDILGVVSLTLYQIGEKDRLTLYDAAMWEQIQNLETIEEIEKWLKAVFERIFESIGKKSNQRINRIIEQIIAYIKDNYDKEISIDDLSKSIYLTPNYLSNIFSQSMGESFTRYLARYRIEKAKELIGTGKYKLYEVGDMVGYKNSDYFRKVFKEFTGISPSEY